jgi:signal transduction histidine kinase
MRRRIEKLNGCFDLTHQPGRGVTVNFSVPLN